MHVTTPCSHCGRPLNAPREFLGRTVRCASCNGEFLLNEPHPAPPPKAPRAPDRTVSRSMLIKVPNIDVNTRPGPANAMICRLESGTLRLIESSEAFGRFVGAAPGDRPRSLLDHVHQDDRGLAEDEFRQAVELGERHDFILRVRWLDGDWHYMRIFTQARYEPDGAIDHVRCFLKDVTDRVHAEQELRRRTEQLTDANERLHQANRKIQEAQGQLVHSEKLAALGTLAAGMAHEINNPLAFATNNMAVLGRDLALLLDLVARHELARPALGRADPEAAAALARARDEADLPYLVENMPRLIDSTRRGLGRVAQIVKNLRAFAHLDRAEVGEIDVNESIDQGLGLLGDSLARLRIEVVRDHAALPPLECAPTHLNQVFLNLPMNAMQAIESAGRPAGRIEVATTLADDGQVLVAITDDGSGIPPEVLPRIFDPFFTTRAIGQGSGLGLSLGHGIIADHGGSIEVESTVGIGTTFRVRLPIRGRPKAKAPPDLDVVPLRWSRRRNPATPAATSALTDRGPSITNPSDFVRGFAKRSRRSSDHRRSRSDSRHRLSMDGASARPGRGSLAGRRIPMTASHGRVGRRGRPWLTTALVASGLCLAAPGARPALACHISHDKPKTIAEETTATPTLPATATPSETTAQAIQAIMKAWDQEAKPEPQVIAPTSTTAPAMTPAAQVMAQGTTVAPPTTPSVRTFHQSTAAPCIPPTPTSKSATSPTAEAQAIAPPAPPLDVPAALKNPPTPAPEPSTILVALALAGAFAWRRRATRPLA